MTPSTSAATPATTSAARVPRGRRGTVATIVAVLGVLVFAGAATEAISLTAHHRTVGYRAAQVAKFGRTTHLGDTVVLAVAVTAFAVGVVLMLAALVPPRRRLVELVESDPDIATGIGVRSLRRALAAAAVGIDGVDDAKVTGRRRLKISASTSLRDNATLPERITTRATALLTELKPARSRTVRVSLERRDG